LDITIVVLTGPDKSSIGFDHIGDHIINKSVLVPNAEFFELGLVLLENLGENVFEETIIFL
jgi:hypothetical protein